MKQTITIEQLKELTPEAMEKLEQYFNRDLITKKPIPKNYWWSIYLSQITIGQMIEFLFENNAFIFAYDTEGAWLEKSQNIVLYWGWENKENNKPELCDALWSAVKEVLNG